MNRKLFLSLIFLPVSFLHAQKYDAYKNDYLGWMKIYKYKGATKKFTLENKTYSIAQLSLIDSFVNWMQASYTPKGALGDVKKYLSPKTGIYNEDMYNSALPHSFGARADVYVYLKQQNGKWVPDNNLGHHWAISANEVPMSYRLQDFEYGKTIIFTLPGYTEHDTEEKTLYDLSKYPSLNKYLLHVSPKFGSILRSSFVILSKKNTMPFVQLTIGEALQLAEEALPVKLAERLKSIQENNIGRAAEIQQQSKQQQEYFARCRETLRLMKEKYKNRLQEPAFAFDMISDLANGYDFFTSAKLKETDRIDKTVPLLKIKPELLPLCKTDQPQWIMIKWYGGELYEDRFKHLHESIVNNFNFDYVYNFFFDPEKVKGVSYKPLRSPLHEERIVTKEKSSTAQKITADASVLFFDDFSSTLEGKTPVGWDADMNAKALRPVVVTESGINWVQLNGHYLNIKDFNKPLPQNFTASFDVFVRKDFHWGTPGLEFYVAGNKKYKNSYDNYIMVKLRPGFDDRDGWATVNVKSPVKSLYPSEVAVPGFSNNKPINRTTVTIKRKGEKLQVFIGHLKIFDEAAALPSDLLLNHFYFNESNQGWPVEEFYITNIKITKD